jgi:hypothetical protein
MIMPNPFVDVATLSGLDLDERRAAIQRADEERAELRQSQIQAQASPVATPDERIRRWEDLHGLRLPRDPNHKLIQVIANDTALPVEEVIAEQRRRADASRAKSGVGA